MKILSLLIPIFLLACQTTSNQIPGEKIMRGSKVDQSYFFVKLPDGQEAKLGAELWSPRSTKWPVTAVILMPGSGFVSRRGTKDDDGVTAYRYPVHITQFWAAEFANAGYYALSYDKRVCTPAHDALCESNPTTDIDALGPAAMAADLDAACEFAKQEWGQQTRLAIWAPDQAGQIALSSKCAKTAAAILFVAPIPYKIDHFLVSGLKEYATHVNGPKGQLLNRAASLNETFQSLKKGQFPEGAKVLGATTAFWLNWIKLTDQTSNLFRQHQGRFTFIIGEKDWLYSKVDLSRVRRLANTKPVLIIDDVDHHLLKDEEMSPSAAVVVTEALGNMVKNR